jgi:hypothetical protein
MWDCAEVPEPERVAVVDTTRTVLAAPSVWVSRPVERLAVPGALGAVTRGVEAESVVAPVRAATAASAPNCTLAACAIAEPDPAAVAGAAQPSDPTIRTASAPSHVTADFRGATRSARVERTRAMTGLQTKE